MAKPTFSVLLLTPNSGNLASIFLSDQNRFRGKVRAANFLPMLDSANVNQKTVQPAFFG